MSLNIECCLQLSEFEVQTGDINDHKYLYHKFLVGMNLRTKAPRCICNVMRIVGFILPPWKF